VALTLAPLQGPLLALAASEGAPPPLRREAVDAHAAGVALLLAGGGASSASVAGVVQDAPVWLAVHARLCVGGDSWSDADRVACAFTAVRTVTAFSRLPPLADALSGAIEQVLRPACLLVQRIEPAYEEAAIFNDAVQGEDEGGVSQLVTQLMELLQSMLAKPKLRSLLKGHVRSFLQLLVPFMRITEAQVKAWRADPNEFLVHEEDDYARGCAARLSGEGLVGELVSHAKREGLRALAAAIAELLGRGERGVAAGEAHAWKLLELALWLFACAAAELQPRALQRGDLAQLAPAVLTAAGGFCADRAVPEFLRARAFALLRRLGDAVCALVPADLPALLQAASCALRQGEPLAVRVCACRAFCRFLSAVDNAPLKEALLVEQGVLTSLGSLLQEADEELLHLTLESLCVIVKQCPGAAATGEAALAPLALEVWRRCAADPLAHLQVLDLVSCAVASDSRLRAAMEERLLPAVKSDLRPGADPHATASAIELYGVLLKRASLPFGPQLWECVGLLLPVVLSSDESGLMQSACDVLCCLVRRSPRQLSEGGGVQPVLRCVERLLGPGLDDDACLHAGQLATLALSQFGGLMPADMAAGLLRALAARLLRAERPYLRQELAVAAGRLLCQDLPGGLSALAGAGAGDGPQHGRLEAFLSAWLAVAGDVRARTARGVATSALCRLHEQCAGDERLQALRVQGLPLAEQLLAAIVARLEFENDRCRRLREGAALGVGGSDDGCDIGALVDDEEDEDEGGDGGGGGRLLSELVDLDGFEELSDDSAEEEGSAAQAHHDPFRDLDVRSMAVEYLAAHAACTAGLPLLADKLRAAVEDARAHP